MSYWSRVPKANIPSAIAQQQPLYPGRAPTGKKVPGIGIFGGYLGDSRPMSEQLVDLQAQRNRNPSAYTLPSSMQKPPQASMQQPGAGSMTQSYMPPATIPQYSDSSAQARSQGLNSFYFHSPQLSGIDTSQYRFTDASGGVDFRKGPAGYMYEFDYPRMFREHNLAPPSEELIPRQEWNNWTDSMWA